MSYRLLPALFAAVSMLGAQAPPGGVWKDARFQALLNSRPAAALVADDELLAPNAASARQGLETLKGDGFALVYLPAPRTIQVKLPRFPSTAIYAWWFDPRAKTAQPAGTCDNDGVRTFTPPPAKGPAGEWVLVLDDLFRTVRAAYCRGSGRPWARRTISRPASRGSSGTRCGSAPTACRTICSTRCGVRTRTTRGALEATRSRWR